MFQNEFRLVTRVLPFLCIALGVASSGCNDLPLLPRRTPNLPGDPGLDPNRCGDQRLCPTPRSGQTLKAMTSAPGSAEVTARVNKIGQLLVERNRQYAVRPMFMTAGLPDPEIVHQGGDLIMVTDSLVAQCQNDEQLAAVLGIELGKIIAEHETQQGAARRLRERPESMNVVRDPGMPITGTPDHTEVAEMVKMYGDRPNARQSANLPNPEAIARVLLNKAGYPENAVDGVRELLKAADANTTMHRQYNGQPAH
jgi:hypothetical protein